MEREDPRDSKKFHERKRSLTNEDIQEILRAFEESRDSLPHICRFGDVSKEDFEESVKFYKHWNTSLASGKSVAAKTLIVLIVTFLVGSAAVGAVVAIFSKGKAI